MTSRTPVPCELAVIGIDIGKEVFHLVGFDAEGKIVLRKKIRRLALVPTFEKLPRCIVGQRKAVAISVRGAQSRRRWSKLGERLCSLSPVWEMIQ